jgi:alpha-1,3-mannosyl-glycoprotein beta-1,2-N-acetylglucosaminyltransferase
MVNILKHNSSSRRRKTSNNFVSGQQAWQRRMFCSVAILVLAWLAGFFAIYVIVGKGNLSPSSSEVLMSLSQDATYSQAEDVYDSPLLIFTCHRAQYLRETLDHVYDALPNCHLGVGCPIFISEDDGIHNEIKIVVEEYKRKFNERSIPVIHLRHSQLSQHVRVGDANAAYKALAKHFGWALTKIFDGKLSNSYKSSYPEYNEKTFPLPQRVIILEEDIKVAPDFFSYMAATAKLLDEDPTLYAVSAFNDNGHLIQEDSERLLRSDFFPGLGWMMSRKLWINEFESKWPDGFWDDWMREPIQRKGRQVIRPEVSRTYHFGRKGGASSDQFGRILNSVKLNTHIVDWQKHDLSYLKNDAFQGQYLELVNKSTLASTLSEAQDLLEAGNVRLEYDSFHDFRLLASSLRIMDDEKAMVPRTAYQGIVECRPYDGRYILFLVPRGGRPFYK